MFTVWTDPARADLSAIDDYCAERNPEFAKRIGSDAIKAGRFLAEHPHAGAEIYTGIRRWRVPRSPYILIYRTTEDGVEILRVWHERQDRSGL